MSNFMQTNLPKVSPASDVIEHENAFYIFLDMPGVAKDELNIEIEGNKLFVSATAMHAVAPRERLHSLEFGDVQYSIMLALSGQVDPDRVEARIENGVVEIMLPKREKPQTGRIRIDVE